MKLSSHPSEALSRKGTPLVAEIAWDNRRLIDKLFVFEEYVVFFDIGWTDPTAGAFRIHTLQGTIEGEDPWTVGGTVIHTLGTNDYLNDAWRAWTESDGYAQASWNKAAEALEMYRKAAGLIG